MTGRCVGGIASAALCFSLLSDPALAQEQEGSFPLVSGTGFSVKAGFEAGLQGVVYDNAFWRLGDTFAPEADYDSSPSWSELYVKPYLTFGADVGGQDLYGKLSFIASFTMGTDIFDAGSSSAVELEDAFIGLRSGGLDVSIGAQPYKLGTGMLLSDGASDGFERGALIFGPRTAWEMTALGRYTLGQTKVEAFYLDPRELDSSDTGTRIAGAAVTHEIAAGRTFGVAAGRVIESTAVWVQAPQGGVGLPEYLENGRDGMEFLTAWGSWAVDERLNFTADFAYETNSTYDMKAWAGRVQASYAFPDLPFQPRVSYGFQTFSGDDPDTAGFESFDPLFYDGSPSGWGSGANSSVVFLNSNASTHQISVTGTISPSDFITMRYFHTRANELLSPLHYGQGVRLDGDSVLISGVTDPHLSDDLYVEYTRLLSEHAFLTAGASVSFPGKGIRELRGGERDVWPGAYLNLVLQF